MLNKRHNSVITLTILLTLVGLSKPAKAFLLAQADTPEVTFTVPEELPKNAQVRIATSNSTGIVNEDLKKSFTAKYPNAKVDVTTTSSDEALEGLLSGNADLAAIGRNLTAEEKSQGFVAVPISREKIAIVVSKDSSYDGNLTFSQFAQVFRGEITDWSEVGGEPGAINLIDMPAANDTRRSFPNYSVFQEGEFAASSSATQVDEDSTDAMVAQLGKNGIGYAVAGDVIDRDDVKIVTMHQTQPDDPRYPFSQPFSLVYQGEPTAATEAFLGYAVTDEGQQTIAQRVGSVSAVSAAAIAAKVADKPANQTNPQENNNEVARADLDDSGKANPDVEDSGKTNADLDDSGKTNPDVEGSGELDGDVDDSGEVNPEFQDSGKINPDVEDSGEPNSEASEPSNEANLEVDDVEAVTPDAKGEEAKTAKADADTPPAVDGGGNAQLDADGKADVDAPAADVDEVKADVNTDGKADADAPAADVDGNAPLDADGNADVDANVPAVEGDAVPAEGEGNATVAEEKSSSPLWWIPLIVGIPILGAIAYKFAGGKEKSDREPALANVPDANAPQGGVNGTFDPDLDGGGGTRIGAGVGGNGGTIERGSVSGTAIATGGAAIAGGAAAARNLSNRTSADIDNDVEQIELENVVAQPETDIDTPIEEIPSNSVNEFTSQETSFQSSEQPTRLQTEPVVDDEANTSGSSGNLSAMGGIAAAGGAGAAASGYLGNRRNGEDVAETNDTSTFDGEAYVGSDDDSATSSTSPTENTDYGTADADATATEFAGDYVLYEEGTETQVDNVDSVDSDSNITTDTDSWVDGDTVSTENISTEDNISADFAVETSDTQTTDLVDGSPTADSSTFNTDTPTVDFDDDTAINEGRDGIGGAAIAGGAAAMGGAAAAASGFFTDSDGQSTEVESIDADITDANDNWVDGDITSTENISTDFVVETSDTQTTDLIDGDNWVDDETTTSSSTFNTDTPTVDFDADTAINEGREGIDGSAAAASGFFTDSNAQSTEVESIDADIADANDNWVDGDITSTENISTDFVVETSDTQTTDLIDGDTAINEGRGGIGSAAAMGGAAAASGFFTDSNAQSTEVESIDADITDANDNWVDGDITSTDNISADFAVETSDTQTTNLVNSDRWVDEGANTPTVDFDDDTAINEGRGGIGGAALAGGAAAMGGAAAAASGFFTDSDGQSTEVESIDADITDGNDNWVDGDITLDSSDSSLEEITFDDATDSGEVDLENITFDDNDSSNASLEEITFDDATDSGEVDLENITFDDNDSSNASLEEITFDDATDSNEVDLENITFDNSDSTVDLEDITFEDNADSTDSTEVSLEDISFDDADNDNSIDDLIDSINSNPSDTSNKQEINLDELGFETQENDTNADLLSNKTADISGLSDEQSNDMNNISEWLDSLETPNQNTDNISEWLDNLSADADGTSQSDASKKQISSEGESEDISFQFLEDLLEREDEENK